MASFYPVSSAESDMITTSFLLNQKLTSYPISSQLTDSNKVYPNQSSVSLSYPDFLSGNSLSAHELAHESIQSRDETAFLPPTTMNMITPRYSDGNSVISSSEPIQHYHGLSLSLGSQEPSTAQMNSDLNQYSNSSLCSLLSSDNGLKNLQYMSFFDQNKEENGFAASLHQGFSGTLIGSKYLKAAQDLLDEIVSVHRASDKAHQKFNGQECSTRIDDGKKDGIGSAEIGESTINGSHDLSPSERHDLQSKLTKLLSMLEEVDRRYKQYWHQMQAVSSSLDMVAGRGAALPYTSLALRTISRQFRCLRDAIKKQIHATQKSLGGDADVNSHGVLSRLRYVDQQLRQQKALQQFGVVRQPWRPQRGLPETAVSVLRAWLFEHFLHPYPKDSEKIVLSRETGLTRSQVANWFINARVRLWKPMIEEMYKEEFGDHAKTESRSSPEQTTRNNQDDTYDSNRDDEFQGSLMSPPANDINHWMHSNELKTYNNNVFHGAKVNFGSNDHMPKTDINFNVGGNIISFENDNIASPNKINSDGNVDLIMDGVMGNDQVSLALGLQHSEKDPTADGVRSKGNDAGPSSSMVLDKLEYYYVDPVNGQNRFGNTHMLSDFVA